MIPVCVPLLDGKELEYIMDCINTNWISSKGRYVDLFERAFSRFCNCQYGISTTNGTSSIHLALASMGLKKDDEVIVPAFTMIGSVFPILYCGARPVLVDCDPETWTIDVRQIEEKISDRTKAIMPVHIYGHPCDMDPILSIAKKYNLAVIEDAAEAHGAEYKGRRAGGLGNIGCFSFYANKIITCGEGGMMVTNDEGIARHARGLRNLSFEEGEKRVYLHSEIGYNYRLTNLQAAVGLAQFERINEFVEMRRKNAALYNKYLSNFGFLKQPVEKDWAKNVYWMYSVVINDSKISRDRLIEKLAKGGVETRPFFVPMNKQPVFRMMHLFRGESYPVAEELSENGLHLPSSSGLKEQDIKLVCDLVGRIFREAC